jgi:hypothetical protein
MSDFSKHILVCHACPNRPGRCAGACLCGLDGIDIRKHAHEASCSLGYHTGTPTPFPIVGTAEDIAQQGRRAWDELHVWTEAFDFNDVAGAGRWLTEFKSRIPGGCDCRDHWDQMLMRTPPPITEGRAAMRAWGIERHDEVNARLGKPVLGVAAAMELRGRSKVA